MLDHSSLQTILIQNGEFRPTTMEE